jgi:hypothetical protein
MGGTSTVAVPVACAPVQQGGARPDGMATKEEKERATAQLAEEARPVFLAIGLDEKVVE